MYAEATGESLPSEMSAMAPGSPLRTFAEKKLRADVASSASLVPNPAELPRIPKLDRLLSVLREVSGFVELQHDAKGRFAHPRLHEFSNTPLIAAAVVAGGAKLDREQTASLMEHRGVAPEWFDDCMILATGLLLAVTRPNAEDE